MNKLSNTIKNFFIKTQRIMCSHDWEYVRAYHRKCKYCGEYQMLIYHRFGPIRTEWTSSNIDID